MTQSNHLGRIVLDFNEWEPPVKRARPVTEIRSDAAYLVTGGLGDFGLATAKWLAAGGAGTIVLAGAARPAPTSRPRWRPYAPAAQTCASSRSTWPTARAWTLCSPGCPTGGHF